MIWKLTSVRLFIARSTQVFRPTWLPFILFIVLSEPSIGQAIPYSYTKKDTIQAIQRLFDNKRAGGRVTTAVGGSLAVIGAGAGLFVGGAVALISLGQKNEILPITLASSAPGLLPTGFGIARLIRYSRRREDVLIDAYESGAPLPGFVRRKLRGRYIQLPAGAASSAPASGR